jgi:hypothetical protein
LFTVIVTTLTISLAVSGQLTAPFKELLIAIEGVILAELILTEITSRLGKPVIVIKTRNKMEKLGFNVRVKDKNIKNAVVLCDGTRINWLESEGNEVETKNLLVGDDPACFYPFRMEITNESQTEDEQIVKLAIFQRMVEYGENFTEKFERTIYRGDFSIPRGYFTSIICTPLSVIPKIYCNIRLIGEGIEDEINRYIGVEFYPILSRSTQSDDCKDIFISLDIKSVKETVSRSP